MMDTYIRQYGRRLYGLCLTLCASKCDAEDLYQEMWLKALTAIDRYDPSREFEPWITRICVNLYRNSLRRRRRSPIFDRFGSNEEKETLLNGVPVTVPDYLPLYQAVDHLPEKLRLTVILYYFRDMDIASAAKILNIPPGTVKSRLNKARTLLKEALTDETDLSF